MTLNPATRSPARTLGLAGLIPFVALTAALLSGIGPPTVVAHAQVAYAATIVSFIGALHWGLVMRDGSADGTVAWRTLGWGVLPSLLAWCALMLPAGQGLLLLAVVVPACLWMDVLLARALSLEAWFVRLRMLLSAVVTLCLLLSARAV